MVFTKPFFKKSLPRISMLACRLLIPLLLILFFLPTVAQHRPKVALVLGGGGAKGAAEVGVLKELERAQVPVDCIVGTSIGSIIGGLYSCGYRADELDSLFTHQDWVKLFNDSKKKEKLPVVKGFGLMKGKRVLSFLDSLVSARPAYTGDGRYPDSINFDRLPIPFRAVAFDIRSMSKAVLSHGSLPLSMRASMSIPGIFKPVNIDSLRLLDGGMIDNLPVDVARQMGAEIVIAIDLTQNKHPDFKPRKKHFLTKQARWLGQRPDIVNYNANRKDADIYINPKLKYGVTDFDEDAIRDMIDIGQKTGETFYDKFVKLRKKLSRHMK